MEGYNANKNVEQTLLNLFDALNDRPIVYHGIYSQIMGTTSAGLLMSQLIYWSKAMNHQKFYKIDNEICDELKMGNKELRNAKKRVIESGVFKVTIKGVPPKTYYQIDLQKLISLISDIQMKNNKTGQINLAQRDKLECPEGTNQFSPKGQIITEKTQILHKEDNNNEPKSVGCTMATAMKSKPHMEPNPVVNPGPKPELKAKPTEESGLEPNGSVVVDYQIEDLMKMIRGWAISRVLLESWAKKYGVGYVLQKIELTKSANAKYPGKYFNRAIELDWLPPAPKEDVETKDKPTEPIFPTHSENVEWYNALTDN